MKKRGMVVIVIVLIAALFTGCPTGLFDAIDDNGSDLILTQAEVDATIGIATILYVAIAEMFYALDEDGTVQGITGTIGDVDDDIDITFNNFDFAVAFGDEDDVVGETVITSGTHEVSVVGTTMTTDLDVTIRFDADDDIDGTYRVIYQSETTDYGLESEEETIITFTVNGRTIDMSIYADLFAQEQG